MERAHKRPAWLIASFLLFEALLGYVIFESIESKNTLLDSYRAEHSAITSISELQSQLQYLGDYSGNCLSAALVDSEANRSPLNERCLSSAREIDRFNDDALGRGATATETATALKNGTLGVASFATIINSASRTYADQINQLYNSSALSLDTDQYAHLLITAYSNTVPYTLELLGRIRGKAILFYKGQISRDELISLRGLAQDNASTQLRILESLEQVDSGAQMDLDSLKSLISERNESFINLALRLNMMQVDDETSTVLRLNKLGEDLILDAQTTAFQLKESFLNSLDNRARIARNDRLLTVLAGIFSQLLLFGLMRQMNLSFQIALQARKSAEKDAEALQNTLKSQEKMFAVIGHELRTPAASLSMLLANMQTDVTPEQVDQAKSTADHLLDVIDDMRVSSHGDITEFTSDQRQFSVIRLLENSIVSTQTLANNKEVGLHLEGKAAAPFGHIGSPKLIRQIVINLIKNAVLHSEGNNVWIQLESNTDDPHYSRFTLRIVDDGVGIPEADRARLFQPFERGNTKSGGSGLGLDICKNLASSLPEGSLSCISNEYGGATFELSFKLERVLKSPEEQNDHSRLRGLKALVVEDTATLRLLAERLLTQYGVSVSTAEDGVEGLKAAMASHFDFILTDIMMPNKDGYEFTQQAIGGGVTAPIIGLTGATVGRESEQLLEHGAKAVLAKPLNISALEKVLESLETGELA